MFSQVIIIPDILCSPPGHLVGWGQGNAKVKEEAGTLAGLHSGSAPDSSVALIFLLSHFTGPRIKSHHVPESLVQGSANGIKPKLLEAPWGKGRQV